MKVVAFVTIGLVLGALAASTLTSSSPCCAVIAQGVRGKFPASAQSLGDSINVWPAMIGLANL